MLSFSNQQRYFLYDGPTDMRKDFAGLSGLVRQHMGHALLSEQNRLSNDNERDT